MKAKDTSHIGMIIGAVGLTLVFIVVMVKFFIMNSIPTIDECKGLILIGIAPAIPFSPVFISTWFDKIIELKNGKSSENPTTDDDLNALISSEIEKEILQ